VNQLFELDNAVLALLIEHWASQVDLSPVNKYNVLHIPEFRD
jgi:hypothetical protein